MKLYFLEIICFLNLKLTQNPLHNLRFQQNHQLHLVIFILILHFVLISILKLHFVLQHFIFLSPYFLIILSLYQLILSFLKVIHQV